MRRAIEYAPNGTWRLLIALSRFAGLRTPSEAFSLRWQDVDWERQRLTITSPKTEHLAGRGYRVIPLFPAARQPNMIAMNRASLKMLRASRTAVNVTGAPAPRPTEVEGIPIVVTDSIVSTEAVEV